MPVSCMAISQPLELTYCFGAPGDGQTLDNTMYHYIRDS